MMSIDSSDRLNNIYAKNKCYHRPKIYVQRTPFVINLDFTKPLFSVGYSTVEDIFLYKEKRREKRILKLRRDIKTYLNANK